MDAFVVVVVGLALPCLLPAWVLVGRSAAILFVAPMIGAAISAVTAELMLGVGGTIVEWDVGLLIGANLVAGSLWWVRRNVWRSERPRDPSVVWTGLVGVVVVAAVAIPLSGLRSPMIGYDTNAIWLTHTLMVSGGHHAFLTGLQNPAYQFSNPDYPPLVPAVGAVTFAFAGRGDLHAVIDMTAFLNACAIGLVGVGVAAVGDSGGRRRRLIATAAGASMCLVGFSVSGNDAINGYTDLLWSAAAVAAVVWGLVLPRSGRALGIAWVCTVVASLTKNEGLTTAVVVLVLISLRYRPVTFRPRILLRQPVRRTFIGGEIRRTSLGWVERIGFVVVPALPGLAWVLLVRLIGLHDAFFGASSPESLATRGAATFRGVDAHLAIVPVAAVVLVVGWYYLGRRRDHSGLGEPAWLWTAWTLSLAVIAATYVFGSLEIHWWLTTSVARTTTFARLLLYADLAIWLIIAVDTLTDRSGSWAVDETGYMNSSSPQIP